MTPAIVTEAHGTLYALPAIRQEFPDHNAELRYRWLPVGTAGVILGDFDTGVTLDTVEYHNPGLTTPVRFDTVNFLIVRVRPYDDLLPPAGHVVVILTDLLHSGGLTSMNSAPMQAGSAMVIESAGAYTILATSEMRLAATDAVNLAVDVLISGFAAPP